MRSKQKALATFAAASVATLGITWVLRDADSSRGGHEKQTGATSFDVYADRGILHMLTLAKRDTRVATDSRHEANQLLRYAHVVHGKHAFEADVPIQEGERIVSRRGNDVQIAAAGQRILAAWQITGKGYGNRGPMRFAESPDAGKTWRISQGPTPAGRCDDQGFFDLMADAQGRFHLVWLEGSGGEKGLRYARQEAGKWRRVQTIDAKTCQCCWNSLRQNAAGELMVLYRSVSPRDMAVAVFSKGRWQSGQRVDNFGWQINACPHAGGALSAARSEYAFAVTWTGATNLQGVYFSRRDNSLGKWNLRRKFGGAYARNPDVAENGRNLAVAWDEYEGDSRVIKAAFSVDAGKSWTQAKTVSPKKTIASYPRLLPEGNRFRVFWSESRNNDLTTRSAPL